MKRKMRADALRAGLSERTLNVLSPCSVEGQRDTRESEGRLSTKFISRNRKPIESGYLLRIVDLTYKYRNKSLSIEKSLFSIRNRNESVFLVRNK
jgi:hypothetical protein